MLFRLTSIAMLLMPAVALAGGMPQEEGRPHKGPRAYYDMCLRDAGLCAADIDASRSPGAGSKAVLSSERMTQLTAVNRQVNRSIESGTDLALYGVSDHWARASEIGDCEDYMIAKKLMLIDQGWSADQLLYAVVEGSQTPYHAVLVVRTDLGDLVLDNLRDEVLPWEETGYRFIIRQSAARPSRWVRVVAPARLASRSLDAIRSRP